jgi:hypothetical protein
MCKSAVSDLVCFRVVVVSPKFTSNYERIVVLKLSPKNLATKKFDINQMILVVVTTAIDHVQQRLSAQHSVCLGLRGHFGF